MSSTFQGWPNYVEANLPSDVSVLSTTHATPIVVTTAANHNLLPNDYVRISGATDPSANGIFQVGGASWSATTISLYTTLGSAIAGTLAGGAAGAVWPLNFGTQITIPGGGDTASVSSLNVAYEALMDRTAFLMADARARATQRSVINNHPWFITGNSAQPYSPGALGSFPNQLTLTNYVAFQFLRNVPNLAGITGFSANVYNGGVSANNVTIAMFGFNTTSLGTPYPSQSVGSSLTYTTVSVASGATTSIYCPATPTVSVDYSLYDYAIGVYIGASGTVSVGCSTTYFSLPFTHW